MYWRDSFFYDTTNVADTYETLFTSPTVTGCVLQSLTIVNKHSSSIDFSAKLVYTSPVTAVSSAVSDSILLSKEWPIAANSTYNPILNSISLVSSWGTAGSFYMPPESYLQIKSSVINSIEVACSVRAYSQEKFLSA